MYRDRNNELEVLALYRGNYKARFYLREISKVAKLPLKTAQNTLSKLEEKKILMSKIEGKNKYFSLNLGNIQTKSLILQAEIHKTISFLEAYPQFKTFLKSVNGNMPIIIFGSFAKIKAEKDSDVDLLAISEKEQRLPFHLLPYEVHQITLSEVSFRRALKEEEPIIKEIEENHIILNNHSFYVNCMWGYYGK